MELLIHLPPTRIPLLILRQNPFFSQNRMQTESILVKEGYLVGLVVDFKAVVGANQERFTAWGQNPGDALYPKIQQLHLVLYFNRKLQVPA